MVDFMLEYIDTFNEQGSRVINALVSDVSAISVFSKFSYI